MRGKEAYKTLELDLVLYQLLQRNKPAGEMIDYIILERVFVEFPRLTKTHFRIFKGCVCKFGGGAILEKF